MLVMESIPDEARLVEFMIAGLQERAAESGRQLLYSRARKGLFRHR
jgi:hypothetical protein